MPDRKGQLLDMLARQPDEVFLRFALAMEHVKLGEDDQALAAFGRVIKLDPSYTAAYTQRAALCEKLSRFDEAKATYRRGIASANARGDHHAASKMQETLDRLVRVTGQ